MTKVTITTASKLDARKLSAFKKAVQKKYGKVELEQRVDPAVIGGVKVIIGSQAIDMTVAGRLTQVKKQLLSQV